MVQHKDMAGGDLHDPKGKYPTALLLDDNTANAYLIEETSGDDYFKIDTTNGSEAVSFGNAVTAPDYNFLGDGAFAVGGAADFASSVECANLRLPESGADPAAVADTGRLYTKDVAGATELFYRDAAGNVIQLTSAGVISVPLAVQEEVTTEAITGTDTALADQLAQTPKANAGVLLYLNGVLCRQGAGKDYTLSGKVITWLANTGTAPDMIVSDVLTACYYY